MTRRVALAMFALLLVLSRPAHAYLDPGTGSILVQSLLAAIAVVSAAVAAFWSRIRRIFTRRGSPDRGEPEDDDDAPRP
jgi:hypothetical protein